MLHGEGEGCCRGLKPMGCQRWVGSIMYYNGCLAVPHPPCCFRPQKSLFRQPDPLLCYSHVQVLFDAVGCFACASHGPHMTTPSPSSMSSRHVMCRPAKTKLREGVEGNDGATSVR
eukprot:scaffold2829_cov119-Isochrysis_galbana.AAC.6